MKLKSSLILLSLTVIAASCSKNQYAQVEPDDLYFTHKDRKEALGQNSITAGPAIASVEPTETPTEYQRSEYSDSHSPVFATPSYGSPTIQQYDQKPYYDTSVNPDYLYEDTQADMGTGSIEYYNEDYAYEQAPPVYETPQVNNYYYGMPSNSYNPSSVWMGANYYSLYRSNRYYMGSPFASDYAYFNGSYYDYNSPFFSPYAYCDPFYNPYGGSSIRLGWGHMSGGGNYGSYYSSNSNNTYNETYYSNGTKVVNKPRQSRNQTSYEVDKTNLPIKTRRADYVPSSSEESGRVANRSNSGRNQFDVNSNNYSRRGNSTTYYTSNSSNPTGRSVQRNNSSSTIQGKSRTTQGVQKRNRTVVVPTRTRTTYVANNNGNRDRNSRTNNVNRSSVNRSGSANRSNGTTRYSARTTNANRKNYGNVGNSSNRSRSSYGTRSSSSGSSATRTSYSSGRSSSRSSYSAPSRSSGSSGRSSYSPSRSSSSRSSGATRSSGSSSSSRSSSKKN